MAPSIPVQKIGGIQGGQVDFYKSAIITANGGAQNNAHGLGRIPVFFQAYVMKIAVAGDEISAITADVTNVTVTGTANLKYQVVAY